MVPPVGSSSISDISTSLLYPTTLLLLLLLLLKQDNYVLSSTTILSFFFFRLSVLCSAKITLTKRTTPVSSLPPFSALNRVDVRSRGTTSVAPCSDSHCYCCCC